MDIKSQLDQFREFRVARFDATLVDFYEALVQFWSESFGKFERKRQDVSAVIVLVNQWKFNLIEKKLSCHVHQQKKIITTSSTSFETSPSQVTNSEYSAKDKSSSPIGFVSAYFTMSLRVMHVSILRLAISP